MLPDDLMMASARAVAAAVAARQTSCAEIMRFTLDRIAATNARANAIVALGDPEALLAEAKAQDARLAAGEPPGPLFGLPMAIKDVNAAAGFPLTRGSPLLRRFVPQADSEMVARLRAAGAIVVGKTNVPEFGMGSNTFNPVYGKTPNAYDPSRTAGGSSGGAAAALALRMLWIADGSDFGGSLRNPAGWNNVWGFRPTIGRVPSDNADVWMPAMTVLGPMARSVADLALLFSVQAGPSPRVPLSLGEPGATFAAPLETDVRGKRIAWAGDFGGAMPFEAGVLDMGRKAARVFEDLGCLVEEAAPNFDFEELIGAYTILRHWMSAVPLMDFYRDPAKRAELKPEAVWEIENAEQLSVFDLSAASTVRSRWLAAVNNFFERYDAFILPTAQVFPFDLDTRWPTEIAGRKMRHYHDWMQCAVPATMAGAPAIAAPAGFNAAGLPMGIQIVGRPRGDLDLLRLAHAYDLATRWPERHPPAYAGSVGAG